MAFQWKQIIPASTRPTAYAVLLNDHGDPGYALHPIVMYALCNDGGDDHVRPIILFDGLISNAYSFDNFCTIVFEKDITEELKQEWVRRSRQIAEFGYDDLASSAHIAGMCIS